jgi:SAM-dependent methyltransferase
MKNLENIFSSIYKNNYWGTGSGPGSSVKNSEEYRQSLLSILADENINSVLDYGCGDWQFSSLINWDKYITSYIGVDVVPFLMEENTKKYANNIIKFETVTKSWIFPTVDLIICKDVLQHLSNEIVRNLIENFVSHSKFLFLTNDITHNKKITNQDCKNGKFRPIDFLKEPWNFEGKIVYERDFKNHIKQGILIKTSDIV